MAWIDASTDEYWGESGLGGYEVSSFNYLGAGIWEGAGIADALYEYHTTPLKGDEYYYTPGSTVSGLRFTLSFIAAEGWSGDLSVRVVTNTDRELTSATVTFPSEVFMAHTFVFEYSAEPDERPVVIHIDGSFGTYYGADPRIYDIQVRLGGESVWTSHVGTIEVL